MKGSARFSALVLAVLLLAALPGCSKDETTLSPQNPVSISIWHYYNGTQKQIFDELVTEFNETVGVDMGIVVEAYSQGDVNELTGKVMDAVNHRVGAEEVPDVFQAYADTAYEINKRGIAADIGAYLTEEEKAAYIPTYLDEGKFEDGGSMKLFPIAKSTEVLVVNMTDWNRFAEATGASDKGFATWEGIAALARQYYEWTDSLTPEQDDGKAMFGRDAVANYMLIGSMQLGTELFEVHGGEVTFQCDREVLRRLWDNYYIPYINGYYAATGRFRSDDAKTGDIIALIGSTSGAAYFPTKVTNPDGSSYGIEGKAFLLPNFEGCEPYAVQQGAGMVVTKSDPRKELAAVTFLKWFTEPEQNLKFSIGSGYLPVRIQANDHAALDEAIAASAGNIPDVLQQSLHIGVDMSRSYHFYTNNAFENGTAARYVVGDLIQEWADRDLAAIRDMIAAGTPRAEAVATYATDEHFDEWYHAFEEALEATR